MLGEGGIGREVQEEVGLHRLKQSKKLREGEKRVIKTNKAFPKHLLGMVPGISIL